LIQKVIAAHQRVKAKAIGVKVREKKNKIIQETQIVTTNMKQLQQILMLKLENI
jgi:hypothetical protein